MEPVRPGQLGQVESPTIPGQETDERNFQPLPSSNQQPNGGAGDISRYDENLPEVYMDDSPRSLPAELKYGSMDSAGNPPKYPAVMDDTMKSPVTDMESSPTSSPAGVAKGTTPSDGSPPQPRNGTICGLKRRMFFIILAVGLIVIAAAIGGGVGGGLAASSSSSKDSDNDSGSDQASTTSSTSTSTSTTSTSATSTSTSAAPEETGIRFLNNETVPDSNKFSFQVFSQNEYEGQASDITNQTGGIDYDFLVRSYVWLPESSGCCVSFCLNETTQGRVGWWCDERYQEKTSETYSRSYIWCGLERIKSNAKCS